MDTIVTMETLKAAINEAIKGGDDNAFNQAVANYNKHKAEVAKALVEAAQKENEALSGSRAKLAEHIRQAVEKWNDIGELAKVKALGFTYKPKGYTEADGTVLDRSSVALTIATVKKARASTGGGSTGKSQAEFGMKLDEIYQKFATPADKALMTAAEAKADYVSVKAKGAAIWTIKNNVKKNAITAGTLKPAK